MECCQHISTLDDISLNTLYYKLAIERLERKRRDIMAIFKECGESWSEAFHTMLFGVVGGIDNRRAMQQLARRVTNNMLMRENGSKLNLEAMLLGGSGLLDIYPEDDYISLLRQEFEHLRAKYNIEPMAAGEWQLMGKYPYNHPTLRLTQLCGCFYRSEFTIQGALECTTNKHVYKFFSGETSDYWLHNFIPANDFKLNSYRMGHLKSDLLGINLIAPIMYAYSCYTQNDTTLNNAVRLQESIPAENNKYTKLWTMAGVELRNALESQAIIQLTKEYCYKLRCEACPLCSLLLR